MRVLVACEFSGIVREAFKARGHDAWSCDLLPTEIPGQHIQGDAIKVINQGWDLIIAHPPCTYLCNSGVRWLAPGGKINPDRHKLMQAACDFFAELYFANACVAVENPVMHGYAKDYLDSAYHIPAQTQSIQPYEHGHGETKRTCLWLRGLPPLKPSSVVDGRKPACHHASPGPSRAQFRSRTYAGIAKAMAEQWS